MLYLAIDQHAKQITVCVRNVDGDTVLRRQVSTRSEKIEAFFQQITALDSDFMAILEVCGFNDWLMDTLRQWKCREIVLIHPEKPSKKKTDRRDAQKLADLLWLNRERLAKGEIVHGLRRVYMVTAKEREDRQLTSLRKSLGQRRTRTLNKIRRIINRHNLIWQYPTKSFQTQAGQKWLKEVELPEIDRLEMNMLLAEWTTWDEQIATVDAKIVERASPSLLTKQFVKHYFNRIQLIRLFCYVLLSFIFAKATNRVPSHYSQMLPTPSSSRMKSTP